MPVGLKCCVLGILMDCRPALPSSSPPSPLSALLGNQHAPNHCPVPPPQGVHKSSEAAAPASPESWCSPESAHREHPANSGA